LVRPGLLRTVDESWAGIRAARRLPAPEDAGGRISARKIRQSLLDRPDAPRLQGVFDEAVLHRPIGGEKVMREQLEALVTAATTRPTVSIQVLPYTAQEHAGLDGRFTILSFPDPADPDIAYVEGTMGDVYLESEIGR